MMNVDDNMKLWHHGSFLRYIVKIIVFQILENVFIYLAIIFLS